MMLKDITLLQWLGLLFGLIIFVGPGIGIFTLLNATKKYNLFSMIVISFALSIAFWTILLAWLKIFSISILYKFVIYIISTLGWTIAFRKKIYKSINLDSYKWEIILWIGIISSIIINMYSLRHMVAGLGSDSFHHTLIANLFVINHGIPSNYQPYFAHIITFNYHFGYHTFIAIISLLCNIEPRLLVLISGPILIGLSSLSITYFVSSRKGLNFATINTAYIPAFFSVFPVAFLLWGRYPQLMGLYILPIILCEYYQYRDNNPNKVISKPILLISLLSAGLLFTHYRVTFMAIVAIFIIESIFLYQNYHKYNFRINCLPILAIGGVTLSFITPWLLQVWNNIHKGYPAQKFTGNIQSFYSLARLGEKVIHYPTNLWILITLLFLLILLLLLKKKIDVYIVWMIFWTLILLGISKSVGKYSIADPGWCNIFSVNS